MYDILLWNPKKSTDPCSI